MVAASLWIGLLMLSIFAITFGSVWLLRGRGFSEFRRTRRPSRTPLGDRLARGDAAEPGGE